MSYGSLREQIAKDRWKLISLDQEDGKGWEACRDYYFAHVQGSPGEKDNFVAECFAYADAVIAAAKAA